PPPMRTPFPYTTLFRSEEAAMWKRNIGLAASFCMGFLASASLLHVVVRAQQSERPGHSHDNPIDVPRDLSGLSIKNPRIRVVHRSEEHTSELQSRENLV